MTGLVMTKLDGTARGGVLVAAAEQYGLPIHAIGVGERIDDLRPFDAERGRARDRRRQRRAAWRDRDRKQSRGPSAGAKLLIDLGPLLVFFAVNCLVRRHHPARPAPSWSRSPRRCWSRSSNTGTSRRCCWFSGVMVLVLGGITIWLHDETLHQDQADHLLCRSSPALLLFGLATGRNLLKMVLGTAYPGLSERGWQLLTRNWALFFVADGDCSTKRSGGRPAPISGSASRSGASCPRPSCSRSANMPMLMRHGMQLEEAKEEPPVPPTE